MSFLMRAAVVPVLAIFLLLLLPPAVSRSTLRSSPDFSREVLPFAKVQTKMNDCWYACIQMVLSARCGLKTKPTQASHSMTMGLRSLPITGRTAELEGDHAGVARENHLTPVQPRNNKVAELEALLGRVGPIILGGDNRFLGIRLGHYRVLAGFRGNGSEKRALMFDPQWRIAGKNGLITMSIQEFQEWMWTDEWTHLPHTALAVAGWSDRARPSWCDAPEHQPK